MFDRPWLMSTPILAATRLMVALNVSSSASQSMYSTLPFTAGTPRNSSPAATHTQSMTARPLLAEPPRP